MSKRPDMARFDQDKDGDFDIWDLILLVAGLSLAGGLWYASMTFSVSGFQITSSEHAWIGWLLGFTVTYLQIMFNRGAQNETLYWFGIFAYLYGVSTNLIGIMGAQNRVFSMEWMRNDPGGFVLNIIVVLFMASLFEFVPEHLIVRLLRPGRSDSDFASEIRRGIDRFMPHNGNRGQRGNNRNNNQPSRQPQRGDNRPQQNQPRNDQPQSGNRNQGGGNQGGGNDRRIPLIPDIDDLMRDRR